IFSSGEILSIKNAPFQINGFIFLTVYLKGSIPEYSFSLLSFEQSDKGYICSGWLLQVLLVS
ncbi:hypothetical protein, partial [Anaerobutyricum hallii]|uniref:hypothetical protein n=1 Tax=Anaerobutyricum hallii TaxID=39488 RepID=UPI00266FB9F9